MDCWIVITDGKLQNFAARSYCFAAIIQVFHALSSRISAPRPWEHGGPPAKAALAAMPVN
jgi:hypothetical protein